MSRGVSGTAVLRVFWEVIEREADRSIGIKKERTVTTPGVNVETPPLEINGLRIAGNCASGETVTVNS